MSRAELTGSDAAKAIYDELTSGNAPKVRTSTPAKERRYIGNGNVSAEVIRIWNRDARYLDAEARPRPLCRTQGRSSLTRLVKSLDPDVDANSIVDAMLAVGLIRKLPRNKYLPTAESVTIGFLHPLAVEHVAKSVIRLVSTVCRNTDPTKALDSLIERYAYVPDLSQDEVKAFSEFTRLQGMAYLSAVDDWLEQRRVRWGNSGSRRGSSEGVAAGVHLVAYLGDDELNLSCASVDACESNGRGGRRGRSRRTPRNSLTAEARV
jgi:hypothetical protein